MKRLLLGAAAAALIAGPAFAQASDSDTINLSGLQADTCTLTHTGSVASGSLSGAALTGTVAFSSVNAQLPVGAFDVTFAGMCNYAHTLGIRATSGGLSNASAVANAPVNGTFVTKVGYDLNASWAALTLTGAELSFANQTAAAPTTPNLAGRTFSTAVGGAATGDLVVEIDVGGSGSTPVVAGAYTEAVLVQIGASL